MLKRFALVLLAVFTVIAVCHGAKPKKRSHMDKTMSARQKKITNSPLENNRLELIKPVKKGVLQLRPTFNSCGFYFGCSKVKSPVLEFRKAGETEWQLALAPIHYFEDGNTKTGLVMNEYRGSIVKLDENTVYEIRFKDGSKVLKQGKFTTWKSDVPVAKTIYIDPANFKAPYTISAKGTPKGWIRYAIKGNKKLAANSNTPVFVVKNAAYVLLDDMTITNGKGSRSVIDISNSTGVRVRNCDISKWGRVGVAKYDTPKGVGMYYINDSKGVPRAVNYDGAIQIFSGSKEIVVERCYIHDPYSRANSWFYSHPAGPQAVMCCKPDHSVVIRYNDFVGSDEHRFNDAVESAGNFHSNGGLNRDADVYGNFMIYCNDDNIELDGGQQNMRCFWNRFEAALCGVSVQGCMTSPVYVFENLFAGMCGEFGESGQTIKTGGGKHGINSYAFFFNNTMVDKGSGISMMATLNSIVKNNVFTHAQSINRADISPRSKYEANSLSSNSRSGFGAGREKYDAKFSNVKTGDFTPVDTGKAVAIPNFLPNGGDRGAFQKENTMSIPFRPVPFVLDTNRIIDVNVKDGNAAPAEVKVLCTVGGDNYRAAYSIRKNDVFDWFEVTPAKGILKSGDKVTFTVRFKPEKMNNRRNYRGAFLVRTADGFSRVVSIYAKTDFVQPFKLEKAGEKAIYIDVFKGKAFNAKKKTSTSLSVKDDARAKDGKVVVSSSRKIYEYTVDVPEDGRYYFMIRGYASGSKPRLQVSVNDAKFDISRQQTEFDRMTWTMLTPGRGFGHMSQHFDLKKGTNKVRIQGTSGGVLHFDGLVLTDSPGSFEPR